MMEGVGFEKVEYFNLALGVVALHRGFKFEAANQWKRLFRWWFVP